VLSSNEDVDMKDVDEEEEDEDEIESDLNPEEGTFHSFLQICFPSFFVFKTRMRMKRQKTRTRHSRLWVVIVILN
jgi:hypothetical protein